ncbi:hypothetical protein EON73_00440 [bacterium]|nr:MAG: hypothetical protein EON73_00440 [bacterium]
MFLGYQSKTSRRRRQTFGLQAGGYQSFALVRKTSCKPLVCKPYKAKLCMAFASRRRQTPYKAKLCKAFESKAFTYNSTGFI